MRSLAVKIGRLVDSMWEKTPAGLARGLVSSHSS